MKNQLCTIAALIPKICGPLAAFIAIFLAGFMGCSDNGQKKARAFVETIFHAKQENLGQFIYSFSQRDSDAQQVLIQTVANLQPPSPAQRYTFEATRQSGRYTMVVLNISWIPQSSVTTFRGGRPIANIKTLWNSSGFLALISCQEGGREKIVGYVFGGAVQLFLGNRDDNIDELVQWFSKNYRG